MSLCLLIALHQTTILDVSLAMTFALLVELCPALRTFTSPC